MSETAIVALVGLGFVGCLINNNSGRAEMANTAGLTAGIGAQTAMRTRPDFDPRPPDIPGFAPHSLDTPVTKKERPSDYFTQKNLPDANRHNQRNYIEQGSNYVRSAPGLNLMCGPKHKQIINPADPAAGVGRGNRPQKVVIYDNKNTYSSLNQLNYDKLSFKGAGQINNSVFSGTIPDTPEWTTTDQTEKLTKYLQSGYQAKPNVQQITGPLTVPVRVLHPERSRTHLESPLKHKIKTALPVASQLPSEKLIIDSKNPSLQYAYSHLSNSDLSQGITNSENKLRN